MKFKNHLFRLVLVLFLPVVFVFNLTAQHHGGIYYFTFLIDNAIVQIDEVALSNKKGKDISLTSSILFPDDFADSIRLITNRALQKKTGKPYDFIYVENAKGIPLKSTGMEGGSDKTAVENLPLATHKKAVEQFDRKEYLTIRIELEEGLGSEIQFDHNSQTKTISPVISVFVKSFDATKKLLWKEYRTLKNVGELQRKEHFIENLSFTKNEYFSAAVILAIYRRLMEDFAAK